MYKIIKLPAALSTGLATVYLVNLVNPVKFPAVKTQIAVPASALFRVAPTFSEDNFACINSRR